MRSPVSVRSPAARLTAVAWLTAVPWLEAVLAAVALLGCPSSRDGGVDPPPGTPAEAPTPKSPWSAAGATPKATPSSTVPRDEIKLVPLHAGEPLPTDTAPVDGEAYGLELLVEVRLRGLAPAPPQVGATHAAASVAQAASTGSLRIVIAADRFRARVGPRTFALEEGWELRADRRRGGAVLIVPGASAPSYRVVPSGGLRALLAERRVDVMPLGPSHVTILEPGTHLGRPTTRVQIATTWGSVVVEQIAAPAAPKSSTPRPDARTSDADQEGSVDGGGEPLCRAILELVAADAALGGAPCTDGAVPVRAEVAYAAGGGLVLEATSLREGSVPRGDIAFPPPAARMSVAPLGEPRTATVANEVLLALPGKGEPAGLELQNKSPTPRFAAIDGVVAALLAAGADRTVTLRSGKHVLEWRTALGEAVEPPREIDVPGSAAATQWVPMPPSSASPMASARKGP